MLFLLALLQVDRLGDDDPAVRDEASKALIRRGAEALPMLEAAQTRDPEVRARIDAILRVIRARQEAVTAYLPKRTGARLTYRKVGADGPDLVLQSRFGNGVFVLEGATEVLEFVWFEGEAPTTPDPQWLLPAVLEGKWG
jgi:hypothetical protein